MSNATRSRSAIRVRRSASVDSGEGAAPAETGRCNGTGALSASSISLRLLRMGVTGGLQHSAAVHDKCGTGHELGAYQEEHGGGNVQRISHAAQRRLRGAALDLIGRDGD